MRWLLACALLFGACGTGTDDVGECFAPWTCLIPDGGPGPDSEPQCDPVAQTVCRGGDKCTWISIDPGNDVGVIRCVPNGSVPIGGACVYGAAGETTGYDDCVAGAICWFGACAELCAGSPDSCTAPLVCTTGELGDTPYGACQ